jgi:3-deoxy-manno-octulosonate cytidylyltransferase (CMP-KDO synthetase)
LYAYQPAVLRQLTLLPPSPLELAESLEQLRWLEAGFAIQTAITELDAFGIDTPEDVVRARQRLGVG